jgi:hypothetical protein
MTRLLGNWPPVTATTMSARASEKATESQWGFWWEQATAPATKGPATSDARGQAKAPRMTNKTNKTISYT